jgi:hypothetical protein
MPSLLPFFSLHVLCIFYNLPHAASRFSSPVLAVGLRFFICIIRCRCISSRFCRVNSSRNSSIEGGGGGKPRSKVSNAFLIISDVPCKP